MVKSKRRSLFKMIKNTHEHNPDWHFGLLIKTMPRSWKDYFCGSVFFPAPGSCEYDFKPRKYRYFDEKLKTHNTQQPFSTILWCGKRVSGGENS